MDTIDNLWHVYIDGKPLEAVVRADESTGEVEILEKHYATGEVVTNPDGSPSTLVLKGKVEKKPNWRLDTGPLFIHEYLDYHPLDLLAKELMESLTKQMEAKIFQRGSNGSLHQLTFTVP